VNVDPTRSAGNDPELIRPNTVRRQMPNAAAAVTDASGGTGFRPAGRSNSASSPS